MTSWLKDDDDDTVEVIDEQEIYSAPPRASNN